jgi:antitoxin CptB
VANIDRGNTHQDLMLCGRATERYTGAASLNARWRVQACQSSVGTSVFRREVEHEAKLTDDLDLRRRRAAYRAAHRGTKEMDALVGRYADAKVMMLEGDALSTFEEFLAIADPTLQGWILANESVSGSAFESLVDDIRIFHGLDRLTEKNG